MKICMMVRNQFIDREWIDQRVLKEAMTLLDQEHAVTVLAEGRYGLNLEKTMVHNGILVLRNQFVPRFHGAMLTLLGRRGSGNGEINYMSGKDQTNVRRIEAHLVHLGIEFFSLVFWVSVLREAVRQRADVYHAHDFDTLMPAYLAARVNGAKLVYDSHELWLENERLAPYLPLQKPVLWLLEKALARGADLTITVSGPIADELAARYGIERPLVLMNCLAYTEVQPSAEVRDSLRGDRGRKVAVFIGALTRNRGLEQLIESARYLREAEVVIVGDGLLRRSLEEKVKEMGLEERVRFMGWIPQRELLAYVASADVGVEPTQSTCLSYRYALGNKLFEYLMAGLPVAVSDQPQRRRIVEEYGVGEVFDEKDPRSIAQAIDSIVSDEARYQEMRRKARWAAKEEFNWEVQAKKLIAAYEKLFAKSVR
jgi:glycosyltransferase involved in cell wall biosynthesis